MNNQAPRLTREELLSAMDVNWGRYLATVNMLTPEEQAMYARASGYDDLRGLLLHLNAHFRRALDVVPRLAQDPTLADSGWNFDPTHAQTEMHANQTLEEIEQDFEDLHTGVAGMMGELDLAAFDDERVYKWLHGIAIDHYLSHEPPGDPQTPSAQHSQIRPEPGHHVTEEDVTSDTAYTSSDPRTRT